MADSSLIEFIRKEKKKGSTDNEIITKLTSVGWTESEAKLALSQEDVPLPPSVKTTSSSMWDTFEHILLFISLYVFATSIGVILHVLVDKHFPPANPDHYYNPSVYLDEWTQSYVRGAMAAILVSYPLFLFFFYRLTKRTLNNTILRNVGARKKLIYFTLVITFLMVLFNVISLVYNFLNGNTSTNFFLHFAVTVGISGIIFAYYVHQIKEDRRFHG